MSSGCLPARGRWHRMEPGWSSSDSPLPREPPQRGFFLPGLRAGFFFAFPGHVRLPNRPTRSVRPQFDPFNWSCRPGADIWPSVEKPSSRLHWSGGSAESNVHARVNWLTACRSDRPTRWFIPSLIRFVGSVLPAHQPACLSQLVDCKHVLEAAFDFV